jgi:hypothetical protein
MDSMRRAHRTALVLTLIGLALAPRPAFAGSVWDPNEEGHVLDIRWVGAYVQADGRLRVTISFFDPVRVRWFNRARDWPRATVFIDGAYYLVFSRTSTGHLSAKLCEGGSGCTARVGVTRPTAKTIRAVVGLFPGYGPTFGSSFHAVTREATAEPPRQRPLVIDRTAGARVT